MRLAEITSPARAAHAPPMLQPSAEVVRAQLEHLRTAVFAGSGKLFAFLRFVVEETLAGRGATLKELVIGSELYGGAIDYDPRIDSTVRVEARRLRRKLDAYYAGPGRRDAVVVSIPTGGYAPHIALRQCGEPAVTPLWPNSGHRPMLAILPFTALCREETAFAAGVTDELIGAAERTAHVRVAPRAIMFQFREGRFSLEEVAACAACDLLLHGTIRQGTSLRRISAELTNRSGQLLWSDRIDLALDDDLDAQERIAAEIVGRLPTSRLRDMALVDAV